MEDTTQPESPKTTKLIMTGEYNASLVENKSPEKYLDKTQEFWAGEEGAERKRLAELMWNEGSAELHNRFGIEPTPFNPDILHILQPINSSELTAELYSPSGQINMNFNLTQDKGKFFKSLGHEMGHFYSKRHILVSQQTSSAVDLQTGLGFANTSPRPYLLDPKTQPPLRAFEIYNEAVVESTMSEICVEIADRTSELQGKIYFPTAYSEAKRLLAFTCRNIALAYNIPEIRKEHGKNAEMEKLAKQLGLGQKITGKEVAEVFTISMWGSKEKGMPPKLNYLRILIDYAYGKGAFKKIANLTSRINPARPMESPSVDNYMYLLNIIRGPERKKAFILPENPVISLSLPDGGLDISVDLSLLPVGTQYLDYWFDNERQKGAATILQRDA